MIEIKSGIRACWAALVLVASAGSAWTHSLAAQLISMPNVGTIVCTGDTADRRDTLVRIVSIRAFVGTSDTANPVLTNAVGALIREHFIAPPTLATIFYPYTYYPIDNMAPDYVMPNVHRPSVRVYGTLRLVIRTGGRLGVLEWTDPTGDTAIDAALMNAVRQENGTDDLREIGPVDGMPSRETRVQLVYADSNQVASPIARFRIPLMGIDAPGDMLVPGRVEYPAARSRGLPESVTLEYIIDESGRAVPSSLHVLSTTNRGFVNSAKNAILQSRFRPATAHGCPVKSVVEQRVLYNQRNP